MNIHDLPTPKHLSIETTQLWFKRALPILRMGTLNIQRVLCEVYDPTILLEIPTDQVKALSKEIVAWGKQQKMWEEHPYGGQTFSLNGVAFLQARLGERKPPQKAWDSFVKAQARCHWLNNAPEHLFPLRIDDILLFGSMTNPEKINHGDCDGVLVYQPKSAKSIQQATKLFQSLAFSWARPSSNYASYRSVMDKTINELDADAFCSLVSDGKTLDTLFDHDPSFSVVSVSNKQWDSNLYNTQLDELFDVVQTAQKNANAHNKAHVYSSIQKAQRRFGGLDLENIAEQEILPLLQRFPKDPKQQNFTAWLAVLGGPDILHSLLTKVNPHTIEQWKTVVEDMPEIAAYWDVAAHPSQKISQNTKNK